MSDPLSFLYYPAKAVTRDLFFSGHTSILRLASFCLNGKKERMIGFGLTALMGSMLLFQHIHYTVDVIVAPVFSWLSWRVVNQCVKRIATSMENMDARCVVLNDVPAELAKSEDKKAVDFPYPPGR